MFVRNGRTVGSILHREAPQGVEPPRAVEAEPKPGSKADLQAQAAELGLPTEGTKAELEDRILQALEDQEVTADGDDNAAG